MTEDGHGGQGGGGIDDGLTVETVRRLKVFTVMVMIDGDEGVSSYHEDKPCQW